MNYKIYEGGRPYMDVIDLLYKEGLLREATVLPSAQQYSVEIEERYLKQIDVNIASMSFNHTRNQSIAELRAAVKYLFDKYSLPIDNGLDIGSGATGFMVEDLLKGIINKHSWAQLELHPDAIANNHTIHPNSTIVQGSYLDLKKLNLNLAIVTGLSSLDATHFISEAIEQIRLSLKKDGMFLHIQDVRPGVGVGFQELKEMNVPLPWKALIMPNNEIIAYRTHEGVLSVGELFKRNLARSIEEADGMELVASNWVNASRPSNGVGSMYFLNSRIIIPHFPHAASIIATVAKRV